MKDLINQIEAYKQRFLHELSAVKTETDLEAFRVAHLSRHGALSSLMKEVSTLSLEEKRR